MFHKVYERTLKLKFHISCASTSIEADGSDAWTQNILINEFYLSALAFLPGPRLPFRCVTRRGKWEIRYKHLKEIVMFWWLINPPCWISWCNAHSQIILCSIRWKVLFTERTPESHLAFVPVSPDRTSSCIEITSSLVGICRSRISSARPIKRTLIYHKFRTRDLRNYGQNIIISQALSSFTARKE